MSSPSFRRTLFLVAAVILGAAFFLTQRTEPPRVLPMTESVPAAPAAPSVAVVKSAPASAADCCPGAAAEPASVVRVANPAARANALPPAQVASALDAFRAWAERYAAVPEAEKAGFLPEGRTLAAARREAMGMLIKQNPQAAIAALLPYELRKALPPEIADVIEHRVSGRGDLMVLAVRPLPGQSPVAREVAHRVAGNPVPVLQRHAAVRRRRGRGEVHIHCAKAATDITLRAVWSTLLSGWSTTGLTEDILTDDGTIQTVKAKVLTAPDVKKFLRLECTRP